MSAKRITDLPEARDFVEFRPDFGRRFLLTVDTEEEFDWGRPLRREGHTVHTVARLARFQEFCEGLGVVPLYLIDYPVATSPAAADILRGPVAAGRAEVGIQLHPWVSPPFHEEVTPHNSFAGNLPEELEREKFRRLRAAITENFGAVPLSYRAGRYGVGPNSAAILSDHAIAFDTSVRARFDYSSEGGPNFRAHPLRPWWLDRTGGLIELPLTTVFWGPLRRLGPRLYPLLWRLPRLRGALSRARLLERIPLTPEGVTVAEAKRGVRTAVAEDLPLLVFSFHSPSLAPGYTPYVRDEADLDALYDWWREIIAYCASLDVRPTSIAELMTAVDLARGPAAS